MLLAIAGVNVPGDPAGAPGPAPTGVLLGRPLQRAPPPEGDEGGEAAVPCPADGAGAAGASECVGAGPGAGADAGVKPLAAARLAALPSHSSVPPPSLLAPPSSLPSAPRKSPALPTLPCAVPGSTRPPALDGETRSLPPAPFTNSASPRTFALSSSLSDGGAWSPPPASLPPRCPSPPPPWRLYVLALCEGGGGGRGGGIGCRSTTAGDPAPPARGPDPKELHELLWGLAPRVGENPAAPCMWRPGDTTLTTGASLPLLAASAWPTAGGGGGSTGRCDAAAVVLPAPLGMMPLLERVGDADVGVPLHTPLSRRGSSPRSRAWMALERACRYRKASTHVLRA